MTTTTATSLNDPTDVTGIPVRGVFANHDGTFTALTYTQSADFRTAKGANRWFIRKVGAETAAKFGVY